MPSRRELSDREKKDPFFNNWAKQINGLAGCIDKYVRPHLPSIQDREREVTDVGINGRVFETFSLRLGVGPCQLTLIDLDQLALLSSESVAQVVQDNLPPRNRLAQVKMTFVNRDIFDVDALPPQQDLVFFGNIHPDLVAAGGIERALQATKPQGVVAVTSLNFREWDDVREHVRQLAQQGIIEVLHHELIDPPLTGALMGDTYITVLRNKAQQTS